MWGIYGFGAWLGFWGLGLGNLGFRVLGLGSQGFGVGDSRV